MKKIMLTIAGMLMFGFAVNAQIDSTNNNYRAPESETQTSSSPYKISNRERVQTKDLPASMRNSLGDQQYKGWENAPVYRDKVTNDYYFDLPTTNGATTYRFDKTGAAIKENSTMPKGT